MSNRARFLSLAALLVSSTAWAGPPPGGKPGSKPASKADVSSFHLDGVKAGSLRNVDVPFATSEVVEESQGPTYFAKKHLGGVRYPDITFTVGADASKPLRDWIWASLQMNYQRKNGSITEGNGEVEFFNALITEIGFPAMDGAQAGKHAYVSMKMAPEYTRRVKSDAAQTLAADPQPLHMENFKLVIDGLETTKVAKIDAITIKQTTQSDDIGDARDYLVEPGKLNFPNLTIYMRPADAQSFIDWHKDFVIMGNCFEDKEKGGTLQYLTADRTDTAFELELHNIGIFAIDEVKIDDRKLLKIDMYVERISLGAGGPQKEGAAPDAPKRKIGKRKPLPGKPSFGKIPKK
jgi:hypothetical protein